MISTYSDFSNNISHLTETVNHIPPKIRRPGRPKVITQELKPLILELHRKGYGYRVISKILLQGGISIHWRTIQRFIKNHNKPQSRPIQICIFAQQ